MSSVPKVISIEDIKWRVAECLRLAAKQGDPRLAREAMEVARMTLQELKILANEGKYDRSYVEKLSRALESIRVPDHSQQEMR